MATPDGYTNVDLSWTESAGDDITYMIEVSSDACEGILEIDYTDATSITFSVRPATDYTFTVTAIVGVDSEKSKESEPAPMCTVQNVSTMLTLQRGA